MLITSPSNSQFKQWRKLQTRKGRQKSKQFLIEGDHLIEDAMASNAPIELLIMSEAYEGAIDTRDYPISRVAKRLSDQLTQTENSPGIFAVLSTDPFIQHQIPEGSHFVLLDRIQDPGNAGTIIRTADAAGYDGVIFGENSVDIFNDKVIRATQGSLFHIPVVTYSLPQAIIELKERGIAVYGSCVSEQAMDYRASHLSHEQVAILMGNEGSGVSPDLLNQVDQQLFIPMPGRAESLNVSVATGILLFEFIAR